MTKILKARCALEPPATVFSRAKSVHFDRYRRLKCTP